MKMDGKNRKEQENGAKVRDLEEYKAENRKKYDPESVLETGIPVTENQNRIDSGNDFCRGSYFCTCAGTA